MSHPGPNALDLAPPDSLSWSPQPFPLPTSWSSSPTTRSTSTLSDTPTSSNSTPSAVNSDRTGVLVGSILGAIAAFLIVVLAILILLRYRRKKRIPPSAEFLNRAPRNSLPFQPLPSSNDDVLPIYDQGTYRNNPFYEKQRATLS